MSLQAYALVGLTAVVAALVGILIYALLRFSAAVQQTRAHAQPSGSETTFMASAVQEAVNRMRDQEREFQARAAASERVSAEIVASMVSGLLLVDVEGRVRLVNPAGQRLLGLSQPSGDYRELLAEVPALRQVIDDALQQARPVLRRAIRLDPSATGVTHIGVTVTPVLDLSGALQSVVCLFADLSTVVALEEQVRLKDSLARLGELTAGIAHEFRNGLATIHGYARLLDVDKLPPLYGTYVSGIREETEELGKVVTNFLNFARPVPLTLGAVDLAAVVDRAADDVRPDVERRGGHVSVTGEFASIEGDEVLLRQAFGNLLRNASEACAASDRPPLIEVSGTKAQDGTLRIVVADNGQGIDPARLDRIFQPFVTTKPQGTGLGLSVVQKIVVTHNGRVAASNRTDGGAAFEVVLPTEQPSHPG